MLVCLFEAQNGTFLWLLYKSHNANWICGEDLTIAIDVDQIHFDANLFAFDAARAIWIIISGEMSVRMKEVLRFTIVKQWSLSEIFPWRFVRSLNRGIILCMKLTMPTHAYRSNKQSNKSLILWTFHLYNEGKINVFSLESHCKSQGAYKIVNQLISLSPERNVCEHH